jgi:hypothetical protein
LGLGKTVIFVITVTVNYSGQNSTQASSASTQEDYLQNGYPGTLPGHQMDQKVFASSTCGFGLWDSPLELSMEGLRVSGFEWRGPIGSSVCR